MVYLVNFPGCYNRLPHRVAKGGWVQRYHVRVLGEQLAGTARAAQPGNDGRLPAGAVYVRAPSIGRQEAAAREAGVNMIVVWL